MAALAMVAGAQPGESAAPGVTVTTLSESMAELRAASTAVAPIASQARRFDKGPHL